MVMKKVSSEVSHFTNNWRGLRNIYNQYARRLGLTTNFIDVLDVLYEKQPCTQKEVMDTLFLPKQTVSFVIKKLNQNHYVELQTDPSDKRRNRVIFTSVGSKYAQKIIQPFINQENKAMKALPKEKRAALNHLLAQYRKQLEIVFGEK